MPRLFAACLALALAWTVGGPGAPVGRALADDASGAPRATAASPAPQDRPAGAPRGAPAAGERTRDGRRLPADVTSQHQLELLGRSLDVVATAGSLPLIDTGSGALQAELGFVAYRLKGADPATRPVTFAVNGGPGASSAYLNLLVAGPWRLPLPVAISSSAPADLVPNAETWLDFTDLVFIDPVGTGYSRANGSEAEIRERYWSVEPDAAVLSAAIARWLRENDRMASPKFLVGESYGGFRGPLIAHRLQADAGIGLSGLVLLSPVLDFGWLSEPRWKPMDFVNRLPSYAAAQRERSGPVSRADLAEVERFAAGDYLLDLLRGPGDADALARISARVAAYTGLDPVLVRQRGGRIDASTFQREARRGEGLVLSAYDAGSPGFDPDPTAPYSGAPDPVLDAMSAPLTSAIVDHLWRHLGWRVPDARYELLNNAVAGAWRYGGGRRPAESFSDLRRAVALDGKFRVLVAHGLSDLVTPYFASELLLRQIPAYGGESRVVLKTYPGGHMFYLRDGSRAAFREDVRALYETALAARSSAPSRPAGH